MEYLRRRRRAIKRIGAVILGGDAIKLVGECALSPCRHRKLHEEPRL